MIKSKSIIAALKDFHMEFFYLVFMYGLTIQSTVVTQLIEDKICLNQFDFDFNDCLVEKSANKTLVIKQASIITGYRATLSKLPAIATTLFVGAWINNYPSHLKLIITMPCMCCILQNLILIGNTIFFKFDPKLILVIDLLPWIFGTTKMAFMALQTYVVLTNPPEKRIIKFASIDVANLIGSIAGQYTGGWIIDRTPWYPNQLHNYLGVFIVSLIFKIIATLFFVLKVPTVYKLNEKRAKKNPYSINQNLSPKSQTSIDRQSSEQYDGPVKEFISKVFSLDAMRKLLATLTKTREGGRKEVLLLLVGAEIVLNIETSFRHSVEYQFSQKAYGWSNYDYSRYHAIIRVIPAFTQLIGSRVFIQKFGMTDITLGLEAIFSHAIEQTITGYWLSTSGFIAATLSGCIFTLFNAAVISILCNVVARNEIAGVFSMVSVATAILTLGTDWVLIRVFNATISTYTGFCFHLFAAASAFSFGILLWIKFKRPHLITQNKKSKQERDSDSNANAQQNTDQIPSTCSHVDGQSEDQPDKY